MKPEKKLPLWNRISQMVRNHLPLTAIIAAAVLLELTMGVMYYSAQHILSDTMQRLVEREMNTIYLTIRNKLANVEVTMDNMACVESDDLKEPDSLMAATRQIVRRNPNFLTVCIPCIPNLYPQHGYWYEPVSVRREALHAAGYPSLGVRRHLLSGALPVARSAFGLRGQAAASAGIQHSGCCRGRSSTPGRRGVRACFVEDDGESRFGHFATSPDGLRYGGNS